MSRFVVITGLIVSAAWSEPVQAAAYYVGEIGARSLARAGANIVNPGDPSAVWLNPAAITLVTGVQLQLDLNLVWLASEFVRDCGGTPNGCADLQPVTRSYPNSSTGAADDSRSYSVAGGKRDVNPAQGTDAAEPGKLGNLNQPSRFDGKKDKVTNLAGAQPIPRLFATFNSDAIGLDGFALGLFAFAPSGADYQFANDAYTRYTLIDRDIIEFFYGVTLAYRYSNWIAVGASLQGVTSGLNQTLRLTGDYNGNEDVNYDIEVRIEGEQHLIPSGAFGFWTNPLKSLGLGDLEFAGSVQLPRFVNTTGPISIEGFGDKFKEEFITPPPGQDQGLAEINDDGAIAHAEFVIPPFYRLGLKYSMDDLFRDGSRTLGINAEVDFVYEQWSTYNHVFISTENLTASLAGGDAQPLPPIVQPKDWTDAWSVRGGATLALFDQMLEVHAGGFYETSAIPNTTYSVELVCGNKVGLGTGVSARLLGMRLDVGYSHVFVFQRVVGQESIVYTGKVDNAVLDNAETRTRVAMGTYNAGYDMLNIGLTVAFDDMFGFGVQAAQPAPVAPAVEQVEQVEQVKQVEPVGAPLHSDQIAPALPPVPPAPQREPSAPLEPAPAAPVPAPAPDETPLPAPTA